MYPVLGFLNLLFVFCLRHFISSLPVRIARCKLQVVVQSGTAAAARWFRLQVSALTPAGESPASSMVSAETCRSAARRNSGGWGGHGMPTDMPKQEAPSG